jgi:hypothetical protein
VAAYLCREDLRRASWSELAEDDLMDGNVTVRITHATIAYKAHGPLEPRRHRSVEARHGDFRVEILIVLGHPQICFASQ